ncbi:MAG: 50S ribosomal protein L22, partial [Spirosomaceae bacterium]|nr:50S ribosomal protein L22 [Spirosomataceae bacterium]
GGRMLKRLRPAPQGRGHRIRKRSHHLTIVIVGKMIATEADVVTEAETVK